MKKQTLVFLHYFGGAASSWNWVTDFLYTDYHCIAINLPGFGGTTPIDEPSIKSYSRFVLEQLEAMQVKNAILIGHSMGGKIAIQVAIDDPASSYISQLILVAPSPSSVERMPVSQQLTMRDCILVAQAIKSVKDAIVISLNSDQYEMAVSTQLLVDQSARHWWIDTGIKDSIAGQSKTITLPITVIASKADPAITYEMTVNDTMPNLPPHSKLTTIDNIGHLMPLEDPQRLALLIKEILTT